MPLTVNAKIMDGACNPLNNKYEYYDGSTIVLKVCTRTIDGRAMLLIMITNIPIVTANHADGETNIPETLTSLVATTADFSALTTKYPDNAYKPRCNNCKGTAMLTNLVPATPDAVAMTAKRLMAVTKRIDSQSIIIDNETNRINSKAGLLIIV